MKKLMMLPVIAAFGVALAAPAFAQDGVGAPPHSGKMIERLDTDKSGSVSRAEFQAKGDEMFAKLDTDKSGDVSKAEFEAAHKRHMEKRKEWKEKREEQQKSGK